MANNVYLLTDFSCCEDFEEFLKRQNHANRAVLDAITAQVVGEWNRKACNVAILGGNLCLIDKYGNTLASAPVVIQDDDTISRDATGKASCVKIKAAGIGKSISLWVGTREQYNKLTNKTPTETAYFFTDYTISDIYNDIASIKNQIKSIQGGSSVEYDELNGWKESVMSGETVVPKSQNATNAVYAFSCGTASAAVSAINADNAKVADKAKKADEATTASKATNADRATTADSTTQINNNGTIFSRKEIWSGSTTIKGGTATFFFASEDTTDKFIVIETDTKRYNPIKVFYNQANYFGENYVYRDVETNAKRLMIGNGNGAGGSSITIKKIYIEL